MAHELGPFGITVNCIRPALSCPTRPRRRSGTATARTDAGPLVAGIATRRLGQPADIANGVQFFRLREVGLVNRPGHRVDGGSGLPVSGSGSTSTGGRPLPRRLGDSSPSPPSAGTPTPDHADRRTLARGRLAFRERPREQTAGHPVVRGEWLGAPGAPTVLVYGPLLRPARRHESDWTAPPFELGHDGDVARGRGVTMTRARLHRAADRARVHRPRGRPAAER